MRIVAVISEDLFNLQPEEYRRSILPDAQRYDCMVVTTMTRRVMPIANLGPLTDEYTLASDHDDRWRTGGMEEDVITEAKLDPESIYRGIKRFVDERENRLGRQKEAFASLGSVLEPQLIPTCPNEGRQHCQGCLPDSRCFKVVRRSSYQTVCE